MNITSIHFKILSCLTINLYSTSELSEIVNISVFKVKRCLKELQYLLNVESILEMHKKLKKSPNLLDDVKKIQSFTPKERECYLILSFLKSNTINLTSLTKVISVTRRTLANDIVNLKKELDFFNLKILISSHYGVVLEGTEKNKRKFFELYFIKMFLEQIYLPMAFQIFFFELKELKKKYNISKLIEEIYTIYQKGGISKHTYTLLHLEVLMYLSIIRKEFEDNSVRIKNTFSTTNIKDFNKLEKLLQDIKFLSNYEIDSIKEFYLKRNIECYFETNRDEILNLKNFFEFLRKNLKMEIILDNDLIMKLTTTIVVMKFKRQFKIDEIYILNNKVAEDYFDKFKIVSNLTKTYYKNIDSFDRTILSMTILNEINRRIEKKIARLNDIVIVYNFLSIQTIKDICKELGLNKIVINKKIISYRDLDYFLETNTIKGIILFENIKLDEKYNEITKVKFSLPLIKLDKFKLSVFI